MPSPHQIVTIQPALTEPTKNLQATRSPSGQQPFKIIIAAENASASMGGEAARPLQYFRRLVARGHDCLLVVHERCHAELSQLDRELLSKIVFVKDQPLQQRLFRFRILKQPAFSPLLGAVSHFITELSQLKEIRGIVDRSGPCVVHVPIPISPRLPCRIYNVGAPVIIGPLNGDMRLPPAFRNQETISERLIGFLARKSASLLNWLIPGKLRAELIFVSNDRTGNALPFKPKNKPIPFVANAVDMSKWSGNGTRTVSSANCLRISFSARLVWWKGADLLLEAVKILSPDITIHVDMIGDGPELPGLKQLADRLDVGSKVSFHGWLNHNESIEIMRQTDVFALPSLREAGGAVVMEAMSLGLPVIAVNWGGPPLYMGEGTGILIEPSSRSELIHALSQAIEKLAREPDYRLKLGCEASARALGSFDWERRIEFLEAFYCSVMKSCDSDRHGDPQAS